MMEAITPAYEMAAMVVIAAVLCTQDMTHHLE